MLHVNADLLVTRPLRLGNTVAEIVARTGLPKKQIVVLKALAWGGVRYPDEFSELFLGRKDGDVSRAIISIIHRIRGRLPWLEIKACGHHRYCVPDSQLSRLKAFLDGDSTEIVVPYKERTRQRRRGH